MINPSVCTLFAYGLLLATKGTMTSAFHRKNEQQSIFYRYYRRKKRKKLENVRLTVSSWNPFRPDHAKPKILNC